MAVAGGDIVEYRVKTCVEGDERHGDPPGVVDGSAKGAVLDHLPAVKEVQQVHNVVRQEAEQHDN